MQQVDFPPIDHIEIRNGQARISGRQTKVKMVISRLLDGTGATVQEVMGQYNLSRAEVLACLSYYYDYQEAIEKYFVAQEKAAQEAAIPLDELVSQLRKRKLQRP
ncbi:MAG: DUF433 domain-containing protein [Chloroflexi bacterium]|nr:DUF433 domain-containing protein [Chloroflexota bacterium]